MRFFSQAGFTSFSLGVFCLPEGLWKRKTQGHKSKITALKEKVCWSAFSQSRFPSSSSFALKYVIERDKKFPKSLFVFILLAKKVQKSPIREIWLAGNIETGGYERENRQLPSRISPLFQWEDPIAWLLYRVRQENCVTSSFSFALTTYFDWKLLFYSVMFSERGGNIRKGQNRVLCDIHSGLFSIAYSPETNLL